MEEEKKIEITDEESEEIIETEEFETMGKGSEE